MANIYRVGGMSCQGCARSVTGAITARVASARVTVNLEKAIVTVDGADAAVVKAAVEGAGFTFEGEAT